MASDEANQYTMVEWTWDPAKDRLNRAKHRGLSLADGVPVLADPLAISRPDPDPRETRWQTVGSAGGITVLFVVHTEPTKRPDGEPEGRIIGVRKATRHEREDYEKDAF